MQITPPEHYLATNRVNTMSLRWADDVSGAFNARACSVALFVSQRATERDDGNRVVLEGAYL
jgi:hypothetical protein